ncbi:MAG TPA: hypothetical protein VK215_10250 [Acidimicrobiales bacterium]|nr:hypothetical protein [Acidimicrobiales bacterium]
MAPESGTEHKTVYAPGCVVVVVGIVVVVVVGIVVVVVVVGIVVVVVVGVDVGAGAVVPVVAVVAVGLAPAGAVGLIVRNVSLKIVGWRDPPFEPEGRDEVSLAVLLA